jgi:2-polyprenyl-3-methyl-5-hydroxy-6-metoxy-1,4-benzoquinol methylase
MPTTVDIPVETLATLSEPTADPAPDDGADTAAGALSGRLLESVVALAELCTVYLGERLGLYRALDETGPVSVAVLARHAGVAERYTQEWCEQQAVAGLIAVDDTTAAAGQRRYSLPPGHDEVLARPESPAYLAPLGLMASGISSGLPAVAEAFRTGEGVPVATYGSAGREAQEALNRTAFVLGTGHWVSMLPDVVETLGRPGARIADLGCGCGWSSVALAQAFPNASVVAVDLDLPSLERGREIAALEGVADRVRFVHADLTSDLPALRQVGFDLVTVFEALHDTSRPADVLTGVRSLLRAGGAALIAEPAVEEAFTAPGGLLERLNLASSVMFCLPTAMAGDDPDPVGAAMRPDVLRDLAGRAGFTTVTVLPAAHPMWRFFRLDV